MTSEIHTPDIKIIQYLTLGLSFLTLIALFIWFIIQYGHTILAKIRATWYHTGRVLWGAGIDYNSLNPHAREESARVQRSINSRVFHIPHSNYMFDEASALCHSLGAELATVEQIAHAHALGAEWCNYGWTKGGYAVYPTQLSTWEKLQQSDNNYEKIQCGLPGLNGGKFNPDMKFGVNCFGKPR